MPPLVLVDCLNLVYRSHFVFKHLSNQSGDPTGVYYGFLRAVLQLQKVSNRIVFCWDGVPGQASRCKPWRKILSPSYKANRHPNEDGSVARSQVPGVLHALGCLGRQSVGVDGMEADDLIGIISNQVQGKVIIYSSDQDLYQLLNPRVEMLRPTRERVRRTTHRSVYTEHHVLPERWAEYLAIGGDSSDNVKAVRGWGPKRAEVLIGGGVDLRKPLSDQPDQWRSDLKPHWSALQLAYNLTRIPTTFDDPRLKLIENPVTDEHINWVLQGANTCNGDRDGFIKFCARYDLNDFLAARNEFFSAKGEAHREAKKSRPC